MSSHETTMTMNEAHRLAAERVRSSYGTFIRLGEGQKTTDDGEVVFKFPLIIRRPRAIHDSSGDSVIDVQFHSKLELGTLTVSGEDRSIDTPHRESLFSKIRDYQDSIEIAIRKALVATSGRNLAHLPFLENQFAPLQDLIAELLLDDSIPYSVLEQRDDDRDKDSYQEYADKLVAIELAKRSEKEYQQGDRLIEIYYDHGDEYHKVLNDAMGVYFEEYWDDQDDWELINKTLGPYLVIAGRYYERALERGEVPVLHEEELRQAILDEYTGKKKRKYLFKFAHYLIQLQEVGVLEPTVKHDGRYWEGQETVREELEAQAETFNEIQELISAYG